MAEIRCILFPCLLSDLLSLPFNFNSTLLRMNRYFKLDVSSLPDYRSSRFGEWYESAKSQFDNGSEFIELARLSERFHAAGSNLVTQVNASNTQGVENPYRKCVQQPTPSA